MKAINDSGEERTLYPGQASYGQRFTNVDMTFDELVDIFSTEQGKTWFKEVLLTRFPPGGSITVIARCTSAVSKKGN